MLKFRFYNTADNTGAYFQIIKISIKAGDSLSGKSNYPGSLFIVNVWWFLPIWAIGPDKKFFEWIRKNRFYSVILTWTVWWSFWEDGSWFRFNENWILLVWWKVTWAEVWCIIGTWVYGPIMRECLEFFVNRNFLFLNKHLPYFL